VREGGLEPPIPFGNQILNLVRESQNVNGNSELGNGPIPGCTDGCRPTPETPVSDDPDLAQVIEAWRSLAADTRTAILAIVEAAQGR
jgi:hypothetical protein